jgi:S-sulfo-L-cysteine synthase (O-acetyl-L-serine-dependent)
MADLMDKPSNRTRAAFLQELVGNTPLLGFRNITRELSRGVELYAKAEWFNPGGSVKDRAALNMILAGERSGELTRDRTILDATSGNTGIALAMLGAARGYRVKLCLPANASPERKQILQAYGAELVLTSPYELTDGAQREARKLSEAEPDRYFYCDQYGNENNWKAHYHTTAEEIWEQTGGRATHWVAGLGTTGTFIGTSRRLKELNPDIRCISFQPDSPLNELEGLKHLETALVPRIYDPEVADEDRGADSDEAVHMTLRLAREEGILVGPSSGAAMAIALQVASELQEGVVVTLFPDSASKYLTRPFWTEG